MCNPDSKAEYFSSLLKLNISLQSITQNDNSCMSKFNNFPQFMPLKCLFHTFISIPGLRHPFSLQDLGPLQQTVKQNIKEGCFFFHFHCFEIGLLLLFLRTVKHFNDKLLLNVTLLLLSDVNTAYFFHHYVTSRKGKGSTSN